jgi:hypothetical protein
VDLVVGGGLSGWWLVGLVVDGGSLVGDASLYGRMGVVSGFSG